MISPYKEKFRVSQIFKGEKHKGLDLVGYGVKTLHSTVNGEVSFVGWNSTDRYYGMGLYIRIKEDNTNRQYYFAHCSKAFVKQGQRVSVGDEIGIEGNTGHSTGSHCHYEIRETTNNMTFLNVSEISGIPNKLGLYSPKEEEEMTQEQFNEYMNTYIATLKQQPPSEWSESSRKWAEENDLIVGDENGALQYKMPVTREQLTVFMKRLYDMR